MEVKETIDWLRNKAIGKIVIRNEYIRYKDAQGFVHMMRVKDLVSQYEYLVNVKLHPRIVVTNIDEIEIFEDLQ